METAHPPLTEGSGSGWIYYDNMNGLSLLNPGQAGFDNWLTPDSICQLCRNHHKKIPTRCNGWA